MVKVPRLNDKVKESIFCVDDCIATFAEKHGLIYQAMYLDELYIDIKKVGDEYKLIFPNNMEENLKKYGGIIIDSIRPSDHMLDDLEEMIDYPKVIMLEIKGMECPWDWRYRKLDWGNHTFLLTGRDKNILTGMDPYYGIEYVELSKKQLMKGYVQARVLSKGLPDEEKLFEYICEKVRCIHSFYYERYELLKRCLDFQVIAGIRERMCNDNCFNDNNIDNNEVIQSLQNCEYSRLRFAIFLLYLNRNKNFLLESCIMLYMNIADLWEKVRALSIKTMISGSNNNEKMSELLNQICELEDNAIYNIKRELCG